jgi:hypothetical protein
MDNDDKIEKASYDSMSFVNAIPDMTCIIAEQQRLEAQKQKAHLHQLKNLASALESICDNRFVEDGIYKGLRKENLIGIMLGTIKEIKL